jgi:hypothetical protein
LLRNKHPILTIDHLIVGVKLSTVIELDVLENVLASLLALIPGEAVDVPRERAVELINTRYRTLRLAPETILDPDLSFLSSDFLEIAAYGHPAVAKATLTGVNTYQPSMSYRSAALINALNTRGGRILSPFSGEVETIDSSLGREWYLHRNDNNICLASQLGSTMVAVNLETVWVFPAKRLILYVECGLREVQIITQTAAVLVRLLLDYTRWVDYLSPIAAATRRIGLTEFSCPHMSHNLWNVQTGWANVLAHIDTSKIDKFILYRNQQFFGTLTELYSDLQFDDSSLQYVRDDQELGSEILENNLLVFTVKDEIFHPDLPRRVKSWARRSCSKEFLVEVQKFCDLADPIVITTIRLDNRSWIEQRSGLPALFARLRDESPNLGVVFDGMSSDTAKGWTSEWMSMQKELDLAEDIRKNLPVGMPTFFGVGRTFAESLVLIEIADCFVAPSGSGMGLYKWIANIPGIAFSNRFVLNVANPGRWPLIVWDQPRYRQDVVPTVYISHNLVVDGDVPHDAISRANFHLDWKDLHEIAAPFLRTVTEAE